MMRKIGAHVSIAGGIEHAPQRAAEVGCSCAQIFSGSPRTWSKSDLDAHAVDEFFDQQRQYGIQPVFIHAIYLINLASDRQSLIDKSIKSLKYDLKFDALIKGSGVVVHLGSHQGRGWVAVKDQLVEVIQEILSDSPDEATLLIENSAGQKGKISSDLVEIRWLLNEVDSPQLGWCFDTCHAFAAGYTLGQETKLAEGRNARQETALEAIGRLKLWDSLKCIHVNDSRDELGSGRDRHANLGMGQIPQEDLRYFLNYPQIEKSPLILEVPGFDGQGPDAKNAQLLQDLCQD